MLREVYKLRLNFWVYALFYKWATANMVKEAVSYNDCSLEDIKKGVEAGYITPQEYKEIMDKS
ncbi:XkdX family protein [Bacillus haynesii]|uniref:XkdX family protein n=1 Tax=Bacillus haynesii TaxID=1925021 RepID=UPI00228199B7|nr:XkdX family protein [Bacillus haynesii]MCY9371541.1 XkdX family protein [Bacillus haynesii]MEC0699291.1 XkdX family protein [Bacillus haynesii]MEC0721281.1 XkdX family protein [Bacillus haynesii]MEC1532054.1 XkdX family protein [Bacillus haynesii]